MCFRNPPQFGLNVLDGACKDANVCVQAIDHDGDGDQDLLVCGQTSLHLYRNNWPVVLLHERHRNSRSNATGHPRCADSRFVLMMASTSWCGSPLAGSRSPPDPGIWGPGPEPGIHFVLTPRGEPSRPETSTVTT